MFLILLLMGSLVCTAGQYTTYGTTTTTPGNVSVLIEPPTITQVATTTAYTYGTTTTSEEPITTSPESSTTTQETTTKPYIYPVVTGLRLKAKCFRELNSTVAEQLLKQYLADIPPELFRLTVKSITKL